MLNPAANADLRPLATGPVRIRAVEAIPLRIPFSNPFTIAAPSSPTRNSVDVLIVRIHTDAGVSGIGETQAWRRQGSSETIENLVHIINNVFKPILVGRSPFDIAQIMSDLDGALYNSVYPQAAVSDALYDVVGKLLDLPVYALLGGKCQSSIPVGIALSINKQGELIEQAERCYEKGYRHLRIKIGIDAREDVENVKSVRKHFGDKVVLRADANGGMTFGEALPLLLKLQEYDLDIIEQPVPGWDLEGMAHLCRAVGVAISADESCTTDHSLMNIVATKAARVIQTKTGKNGGIYYTRGLWTIAKAAGIGIFPGNHPGTSVHTASVAHLCAAWPHGHLVGDFQTFATDMINTDIVTEPITMEKGHVQVPSGPGLGVELDEGKIKHCRLDI